MSQKRRKLIQSLVKHYFPDLDLTLSTKKLEELLSYRLGPRNRTFPSGSPLLDKNILHYLDLTLLKFGEKKSFYIETLLKDETFWAKKIQTFLDITFPIGSPRTQSYRDQYEEILKEKSPENRLYILDFGPKTIDFVEKLLKSVTDYPIAFIIRKGSYPVLDYIMNELEEPKRKVIREIHFNRQEISGRTLRYLLGAHPEYQDFLSNIMLDSQNLEIVRVLLETSSFLERKEYLRELIYSPGNLKVLEYLSKNYEETVRDHLLSIIERLISKKPTLDNKLVLFLFKRFPEEFPKGGLDIFLTSPNLKYFDKADKLELFDYNYLIQEYLEILAANSQALLLLLDLVYKKARTPKEGAEILEDLIKTNKIFDPKKNNRSRNLWVPILKTYGNILDLKFLQDILRIYVRSSLKEIYGGKTVKEVFGNLLTKIPLKKEELEKILKEEQEALDKEYEG